MIPTKDSRIQITAPIEVNLGHPHLGIVKGLMEKDRDTVQILVIPRDRASVPIKNLGLIHREIINRIHNPISRTIMS